MAKKILIVGNTSDNHLKRLKKYIEDLNTIHEIEFETLNINNQVNEALFDKNIQIKKHFPKLLYKIKFLRFILKFLDCNFSFNQIGQYDLINIHFLTIDSFFLLYLYKRKSKKIMITPWGSDVYRISNVLRIMYQKVYNAADYISADTSIKFKEDVRKKFDVPNNKFVNLGFGSEMIDILMNNVLITKSIAKRELGVESSYIITCGYNRSYGQNHFHIINALIGIKEILPSNTFLFFPMTYGPKDEDYKNNIENILANSGLSYRIFYRYLSNDDQLLLRLSTDLFIHIQDSDANSATIQEYLYCKTDIINGSWLRYPQFEKYGIPYYTTDSKDKLSNSLKDYFLRESNITISNDLINDIKQNAWSVKIKEWFHFYLSI